MKSSDAQRESTAEAPRRDFFSAAAATLLGALAAAIPLFIGGFAFLDPLARKRLPLRADASTTGPGEAFTRICSIQALTEDGPPQRFPVIDDQVDAWNFTPAQPIGAVFVQRLSENEVRVFHSTCPHAGCSVTCDGTAFNCPCHNSSFNLDGSKRVSSSGRENPSPRDLDRLDVDASQLAQGEVWVRFQNFYTGREEQVAKL